MADPTGNVLIDHWDKFVTVIGAVLSAVWWSARRVAGLEKRMDSVERQIAEIREAQKETTATIVKIGSELGEQNERTRQFWIEKWPAVTRTEERVRSVELLLKTHLKAKDWKDDET